MRARNRWSAGATSLALGAALAGPAAGLTGCGGDDPGPPAPPPLRPVRYTVAHTQDAAQARTFSGLAQASEQSRLSFRVSGLLREVAVKVGDRVKKNDLVARIEATDLKLKASEAAAQRAQAKAQTRNAKSNYRRVRKLYEARSASRAELDSARANADSARMSLSAANQAVALLRRQVDYATLRAPAAGTISAVAAEVGENVAAGAPMVTLQSGGEVEVQVAVPGSMVSQIAPGAEAEVRFSSVPGETFAGSVFEVGVASGRSTTYPVTVRLAEPDERVRPGMAAEATIRFAPDPQARFPRLPPPAVGEDRAGRFVFKLAQVKDGVGVVQRAPVSVGALTSAGVQITQGVADGDLVVTAGVNRLSDGVKVKVPAPPGDAATAGPAEAPPSAPGSRPAPAPGSGPGSGAAPASDAGE